MKKNILILFVIFLLPLLAWGQGEKVRDYIKMVSAGRVSEVKNKLPDLLAQYPNDPAVLLLHGLVLDDVRKAIDIYRRIVKEFRETEWADEAWWRIVQFYAMTNNISKAREELAEYRKVFPDSDHLIYVTDALRVAESLASFKAEPEQKNNNEPPAKKEAQKPEKTTEKIPEKSKEKTEQTDKQTEKKTIEKWGLQVGIYSSQAAADAEKQKFTKRRLQAEIRIKIIDGHKMYAVIIGDYNSKERAEENKPIVKQICNCEPLLFKK